ncbi:MAG: hypothetical protein PVI57_02710 [Gemmatimonadota bacterium]|jgi:hypothetical protein
MTPATRSTKCSTCGANIAGEATACLLCGAPLDPDAGVSSGTPRPVRAARAASAVEVEIFAHTISAGRKLGVLRHGEAERLRAQLVAADPSGTWWTYVGESRQWYRSDAGHWISADAPQTIRLEADRLSRLRAMTRDTLERLDTLTVERPVSPGAGEAPSGGLHVEEPLAPGPPSESPRFCTRCGGALRPGTKFCVRCGAPASHPPGGGR